MLLLLFVAFITCISVDGAYGAMYTGTDCNADNMIAVTHMTPDCVTNPLGGSFHYECSANMFNWTVQPYSDINCAYKYGKPIHIANTEECLPGEEGTYSMMYSCDEPSYTFGYHEYAVPMIANNSDVGGADNPIVATSNTKLYKCQKQPNSHKHVTSECDSSTNVGTLKIYETSLCLIHIHKLTMNPNDVIDVGQYLEGEPVIYMKYLGCSN